MKIKRNILGAEIEIELTADEVRSAYDAHQYELDEQEVNDALMTTCEYDDIPADVLKELTQMYRMRMNDAGAPNAFSMANKIIEENRILLNPYKKKEEWKVYEIEVTQTRKKTWTVRARNDEQAEEIFEEWRESHIREFDYEMSDAEIDDEETGSAYECEGDPEYADIIVEDGDE